LTAALKSRLIERLSSPRQSESAHPINTIFRVRPQLEKGCIYWKVIKKGWPASRNYFVHGSVQNFAYMQNWQTIEFFIETLEFIFGAGDLIDAGWNIQEWHRRGTTMSHPYGAYKVTYPTGLAELKALLQTQAESSSNVD